MFFLFYINLWCPVLQHCVWTSFLTKTEVKTRVGHVTWAELLGHARVMGTVKKDLIIVRLG